MIADNQPETKRQRMMHKSNKCKADTILTKDKDDVDISSWLGLDVNLAKAQMWLVFCKIEYIGLSQNWINFFNMAWSILYMMMMMGSDGCVVLIRECAEYKLEKMSRLLA